jgi:hypothetical protein
VSSVQLGARDAPERRRGRRGRRGEDEVERARRVAATAARPGKARATRDAGGAMSGTWARRSAAAIAPVARGIVVGGRRAIRRRGLSLAGGAAACRGAREGRWQVGPPSPCASGGRESPKAFRTWSGKGVPPVTCRAKMF